MQKFTPSLDKANFALKTIKSDARKQLLDLLDTVRGKKALVLEPHFVQPLGLIVDAITLKEHGVEMFLVLENQPGVVSSLLDRGVKHLVYLLAARVESVQAAVAHVGMCRSMGAVLDHTALLMPRSMKTCELLLDHAGLLGDVAVRLWPLSFVPLDEDLLSLEAPFAFKELAVDGDSSCLWSLAHALTALQASRGAIRHIKGKGAWAAGVHRIMARMRKEQGVAAPASGSDGGIDTLILIDRTVDLITPMCTQLTYEGLLDEVLGLSYGQIRNAPTAVAATGPTTSAADAAAPAPPQKVSGLTSADPVFFQTRDLFYMGARRWLNETLRSIQQFRDAGMSGADISRLRGFVTELRDKFARIPLHTSLVEQLGRALSAPSFAARQRVEAALLDEQDELGAIEEMIAAGEGMLPVLRLLCLYCAVHGGVPRRRWDALRRDLLNTYGHQHLITLQSLAKAGLLQRRERDTARRGAFATAKPILKLLMQEGEAVDELDPVDIHFAFAGYAPLSARIVQQALSPGGWAAAEAALSALPGPQFEVAQAVDDQGRPVERRDKGGAGGGEQRRDVNNKASTGSSTTAAGGTAAAISQQPPSNGGAGVSSGKKRTVMVVFIGGVTYAEIAALRFLARKGMVDCEFVVASTKVVNGGSLLAGLAPPQEKAA